MMAYSLSKWKYLHILFGFPIDIRAYGSLSLLVNTPEYIYINGVFYFMLLQPHNN